MEILLTIISFFFFGLVGILMLGFSFSVGFYIYLVIMSLRRGDDYE